MTEFFTHNKEVWANSVVEEIERMTIGIASSSADLGSCFSG
jgi:hypothetical protein